MVISGKQIQNVLKVYSEQNSTVKKPKTEKEQSVQPQDQLILSQGGQEFGAILQSIINMSDVRPEKVDEFSKKINAGNYQVDAGDIADKMIGRTLADNNLR
jgi:negative regulator of flagellin synthesis FlgM